MVSRVLKKLMDSINDEMLSRQGGSTSERGHFIQIKFDSKEELVAGEEIFTALLSTYTIDMLANLAGSLATGGKGPKNTKIETSDADKTLTVQMFANLPLRGLLHDLEIMQDSINNFDKGYPVLQVTQNPGVDYYPIFTRQSLDQSMRVLSALAKLHDPENFCQTSLFSASGGLGRKIGSITPTTPAVLVAKTTFDRIIAAERDQDLGKPPISKNM